MPGRIALVVHDLDRGKGHGRYAYEIGKRLQARFPIEVCVASVESELRSQFDLVHVPSWRWKSLTSILSFIPTSEWIIRRRHYQLVHTQGLASWTADLITAHICNAARLAHDPSLRRDHPGFTRLVLPLERAFYRRQRPRRLIAVSRRVASDIRSFYGWRRPVEVIYHGTDTRWFSPAESLDRRVALRRELNLGTNQWVWLFAGEARKGLRQAILQLPFFPHAMLLVVSRSDMRNYGMLAEHAGVAGRVRFVGPTANLNRFYQATDLFLYPSDYDAFGMVVAEAMASELPVVVGREIGAAEWIQDGKNGFLCEPQDPESIREALAKLTSNPALSRIVGGAARKTAEAHSWDECAGRTAAIYQQVLAEKPVP